MKKLLMFLSIILTSYVYGQCGYILDNGVKYKIPCDWDYLSFHEDTIRIQELLFIDLINKERRKKNLSPLVYDETLYTNVAKPQAIRMSNEGEVSHTKENVWECCTPLFYNYRQTNFGELGIETFKWSKPHWNILMLPSITKIAVRIEIDKNYSTDKKGKVYMSVVML